MVRHRRPGHDGPVRRPLRYTDAVNLLGGGQNRLLRMLEDGSSGLMLGLGIFDLFEARSEAFKLTGQVLKDFGRKLRGTDRMTRTQRVEAAHAVIVVTAFFEALDEFMAGMGARQGMKLRASEQTEIVRRRTTGETGLQGLLLALMDAVAPPVTGSTAIDSFYVELAVHVEHYIKGLAFWDELNETQRIRLSEQLDTHLPRRSTAKYRANLHRLAAECPEFGIWLNFWEREGDRDAVRSGLAELQRLLTDTFRPHPAGALSLAYRGALEDPIADPEGLDPTLTLPSVEDSYLDHRFSRDGQSRGNLYQHLAAHLVSREATESPMLILGQPGSGKSLLSRVLAARLPTDRFLPVRIELRHVDTDTEFDIQREIEAAVLRDCGESVRWPALVAASPTGAMPVVLLDGFDELLLATGVAQTDFLQRVARFQAREARLGRPLAVIVTSRTAVAHRATLPPGSPVLTLEAFDEAQIRAWLAKWNETNAGHFASTGTRPLAAETVLQFRDLAEQPLLLFLLALYDSAHNDLHRLSAQQLDSAGVYERLLAEFARRELLKESDSTDLGRRVEGELLRLSIVAFAMFNRGEQWIDDVSLSKDLKALRPNAPDRPRAGLRTPLSSGEVAIGRFFFVHKSQTTHGGTKAHTYEFLHATFSEYLIARMVNRLLSELVVQHDTLRNAVSFAIDDTLLHALLSYECLAARAPIVEFLTALIDRRTDAERESLTSVLLALFHSARNERVGNAFPDYQPVRIDVIKRYATWRANLVLLAVLAGGAISPGQLFTEGFQGWAPEAHTWYGQLSAEGWSGITNSLGIQRVGEAHLRDIRLTRSGATLDEPDFDLGWNYGRLKGADEWQFGTTTTIFRHHRSAALLTDNARDLDANSLMPLVEALGNLARTVWTKSDKPGVTVAHLLLATMMAPFTDKQLSSTPEDLRQVLRTAKRLPLPDPLVKVIINLLISATEFGVLPRESALDVLRITNALATRDSQAAYLAIRLGDVLARPTAPTPPTSAASPPPAPSPAASSPETTATPPDAP